MNISAKGWKEDQKNYQNIPKIQFDVNVANNNDTDQCC